MAKTKCPQCGKLSPLPDGCVGRRVRCPGKDCNTEFIAAAVGPVLSTGASAAGKVSSASVVGNPGTASSSRTVTVSARPVASGGTLRAVSCWMAAFLAFALPVAGASYFVVQNWSSGSAVAGDGPGASEAYAAIEVGSKSVKYTVFNVVSRAGEDDDFAVVANNNTSTVLGKNMGKTLRLNPEGLEQSRVAAEAYVKLMRDKHFIPLNRIYVVASADLFGPIAQTKALDAVEKKAALAQARTELAEVMRKATGKALVFVESEQVARFQIQSVIPARHRGDGVYIDIGGSGTRGGYLDGVVLRKMRRGRPGVSVVLSGKVDEKELLKAFRDEVENTEGFRGRKHIYINGGIIWVAATVIHPENRSAKVPLTAAELRTFAARVRANPDLLQTIRPPAEMPEEARAALEKDLVKMRTRIAPAYLLAGCKVVLALLDALDLDAKDKKLSFYRNGDFAWVLSYVHEESRKAGR